MQTSSDMIFVTLLILIPCIAITGPFTAGLSYVTRNWARDEHAFPWADYKDAIKANWKQGLLVSTITGCVPFLVYICWRFYGDMAVGNAVWVIPQMLILMLGILWALAVTYMYPMMVTYQMNFRTIIRNSFILAGRAAAGQRGHSTAALRPDGAVHRDFPADASAVGAAAPVRVLPHLRLRVQPLHHRQLHQRGV